MFCDNCGSMMKKDGNSMVCTQCGDRDENADNEEYVSTTRQKNDELIETEEDANFEGKPTAEVNCDECNNDEAWYTIKQTASADEPPTRFFKCTECGNRWRDYN